MMRYYYDCTIKAAYMAKEFGVKIYLREKPKDGKSFSSIVHEIEIFNEGRKRIEVTENFTTDGTWRKEIKHTETNEQEYLKQPTGFEYRLWIAPESEALFEPKTYDLGRDQYADIFSRNTADDAWVCENPTLELAGDNEVKIIMRDGKHFFSPLKETSN